MEFLITRTSMYSNERPDVDVAWLTVYEKEIPVVDRRVCTLAEARNSPWGQDFFSYGTNHIDLPNGHCQRELQLTKRWAVDISSVEDLVKLQTELGSEIIIRDDWDNPSLKTIEIYDDYR